MRATQLAWVILLSILGACAVDPADREVIMPPSAFHEYLGQLVAPVTADSGERLVSATLEVRCDIETSVIACVRATDPFDSSVAAAWCARRVCSYEVEPYSVTPPDPAASDHQVLELIVLSEELEAVQCRGAMLTIAAASGAK